MTPLIRIAERLINRPLLVHPDKLPIVLGVLQGRIPLANIGELRDLALEHAAQLPAGAAQVLTGPKPEASRFAGSKYDGQTELPFARTSDGVAVVSVIGSLVSRGAWLGSSSGETSYEGVGYQIQSAAADAKTKGIVLDIHSGGGEATGAFELADIVRAAAKQKPVTAVIGGMAASAAYAIASAADRIVINTSGVAGSIGVVMLHADFSKQLEMDGVKPTFIFAGAHKVDGNQLQPLTSEVQADLQREVDHYYELFVSSVAAGRKNLSPAQIKATQARTYIGEEAVQMGLADSVGTFDEVLADLSRGSSRVSLSQPMKGNPMTDKTTAGTAAAQPAMITQADHEAAVAAARTAGADAERSRILGIEANAMPGHEQLVADMKADGKTTPDQAATRILAAEKQLRGQQAQAVVDAGNVAAGLKSTASAAIEKPANAAQATTPEGWKAEYEASASLQAEFVDAESYVSFKKAEAAGKVKVLGKKRA